MILMFTVNKEYFIMTYLNSGACNFNFDFLYFGMKILSSFFV